MGGGRNLIDRIAKLLKVLLHKVSQLLRIRNVNLVENHDLWSFNKRHLPLGDLILLKLLKDHLEIAHWVATIFQCGAVDYVAKGAAALDMPKELKTEPLTLACTLDETRNVRNGVALVASLHHTKVWMQGR